MNKIHIPLNKEKTKKKYLDLIRDAKDLGEETEVTRLQQEWQTLKTEKGW